MFGVGVAAFGAAEMLLSCVVCGLWVDGRCVVKDGGAAIGAP